MALAPSVVLAIAGSLYVRWRVTKPIARAIDAAFQSSHGARTARARPDGGRDARDVSTAVNALIDEVDRLRSRSGALTEDEVDRLVAAIESMAVGTGPRLVGEKNAQLSRCGVAISEARRSFAVRERELHGLSLDMARCASRVLAAVRRLRDAAEEQVDTLGRLASIATESTERVRLLGDGLAETLELFASGSSAYRRSAQNLRASLLSVGRRVKDIDEGTRRIESMVAKTEHIGESLSLLARGPSDPLTPGRAASVVGESRATLESIVREMQGLRDDLRAVGATLEAVVTSAPEPTFDVHPSIVVHLREAASVLVRTVETESEGMKALESTARTMAEAVGALLESHARMADLGPRLGAALAGLCDGQDFERDLIARLDALRQEVDAVAGEGGMTQGAESLLAEVREAAEAARARLGRLVNAAEAAVDIMRGSRS